MLSLLSLINTMSLHLSLSNPHGSFDILFTGIQKALMKDLYFRNKSELYLENWSAHKND